ncbi:MAG TPA: class II aldolase/adducin family protein, partial [Bacteroidales bacterium]|nr:class II aldolase/adducin family protein [Bacteroidales bacterium]
KKHPHVNSVISSQSPYLMAFAVAHAPFDVRTIPESWIFLQDVSLIPFSERKTVPGLLSKDRPAVIVQNDSFIVTGDKLLQTFDKLEVAEFSAKSIVMSTSLGKMVPINQPQIDDLRRVFLKN